ncbi:MAG: NADH-quinone oxidoreductase subunit L [Thermoguttaceae bacterium]|jgi:NADH-quinone oxidoreductase subunit L
MMNDIKTLLILIPALPLAAALLTAVLGPRILRARSHWPTVISLSISCAASLLLVYQIHQENKDSAGTGLAKTIFDCEKHVHIVPLWSWAQTDNAYLRPPATGKAPTQPPGWGNFKVEVVLRADPLTAVMLAVVTFISLLVAVYSIGYMHGDRGYWRFYSYIPLFVFSMTMLVSASNFVLLYVFWEAVGLCSYLLIGFWYEKPEAVAAGKKAFLVTRIGDFGFALGIFLIWSVYGTLDFHDTVVNGTITNAGVLGQTRLAAPGMFAGGSIGTAICLLLLLGACGKSAQFPLHVWLPDAMEGPSPVSALIHAATMVTAGVYMLARCMPLYSVSPAALHVVTIIGGFTALLGAFIAITQTDLKRILAYSTISHIGYMFLAMGTGTLIGVTAGMFHLVTHAFFKALLFLAAGSVMHAMGGVIDIRQLGGLRKRMPVTHWTFLFGALALVGMFPFAGFWSKDAILLAVAEKSRAGVIDPIYEVFFWTTLLGILLMDLYIFRPFFISFYGKEKIPEEAGSHAHESPRSMTVPLAILALGSLVVGAWLEWSQGLSDLLARTPSLAFLGDAVHNTAQEEMHITIAIWSTVLVLIGVLFTAWLYIGPRQKAVEKITAALDMVGLYRLSYGKVFFDPLYFAVVVWPLEVFARFCAWFDRNVIDYLVDIIGFLPKLLGSMLRPLQGGLIQFYALVMILGVLVLMVVLLM